MSAPPPSVRGAPRRPRLLASAEIVARGRGFVVRRGDAAVPIAAEERLTLGLLDGTRSLPELVAASRTLSEPLAPLALFALVRKLDAASLLVDLDTAEAALSVVPTPPVLPPKRKRFARVLAPRYALPGTAWLFAPGAACPPRAALACAAVVGLALLGVVLRAAVEGRARPLFDPFARATGPGSLALLTLGAAVAALSARGFARGFALRSMGLACRGARLGLTLGVPHLDAEDGARRDATRGQRAGLALAGLTGMAAFAAVAGGLAPRMASPTLAPVAAIALLLFFIDLSPHARTDGYTLLAIAARTPRHAQRSASWLARRALRDVLAARPSTPAEQPFVLVATCWVAHALVAQAWIALALFPGLASFARRVALGGSGASLGLTLAALVTPLAVVAGGAVALAFTLVRTVAHAVRDRGVDAPRRTAPVTTLEAEALARALAGVPALAVLDEPTHAAVVAALSVATFAPGAVLRRQGEPETRLVVVLDGSARVTVEDASGLAHDVGGVGDGGYFGQAALLGDLEARSTVRAARALRALVLEGAAFRLATGEREGAERARAMLRDVALLRRHPLLEGVGSEALCRLLAMAEPVALAPGDRVDLRGHGQLLLLREGRAVTTRGSTDLAEVAPGAFVGPHPAADEATGLRAIDACVVVRVDASTWSELVLGGER